MEKWSEPHKRRQEMQIHSEKTPAGPVLDYDGNGSYFVNTREAHVLINGGTGTGKSRCLLIPTLKAIIKSGEDFVVVDPKGELYKYTSAEVRSEYKNVYTIDFRNPLCSQKINPLMGAYEDYNSGMPYRKENAMRTIQSLAIAHYPIEKNTDPFWPISARSLFIALACALLERGNEDEINMKSLYNMIITSDSRMASSNGLGTSTVLREFAESFPRDSVVYENLQNYLQTAADTRGGIRSSMIEGISMYAYSDALCAMLSGNDLRINELDAKEKTAIYIILPDETPAYDRVAGNILNILLQHYIQIASEKYGGCLPRKKNFLIDETGSIIDAVPCLETAMVAGRSRGIRCYLTLQNYTAQLRNVVGEEMADTIVSNCDIQIFFRTPNYQVCEEISRRCGNKYITNIDGVIVREQPLIKPVDIEALKTRQALVMIAGRIKYVTTFPDFTETFENQNEARQEIPRIGIERPVKIFDMETHVKKIQQEERKRQEEKKRREERNLQESLSLAHEEEDEETQLRELINQFFATDAQEEKEPDEVVVSYDLTLLYVKNRCNVKVARVIAKHTEFSENEAKLLMKALPYTFYFDSEVSCERARKAITAAGGQVV